MAIVLIHGNPETPLVWGPLIGRLRSDEVVTLQLPGFGCPTPEGWTATKEEYLVWLAAALEGLAAASGPLDVVGHDWGGALMMPAVSSRPDLVRSWACDVLGLYHPEYVWHDFAQVWQTPTAGEHYFEEFLATPMEDRIALYEALGIPRDVGAPMLEVTDAEMARCVLALYRSAIQPAMTEWGASLGGAASVPGLSIAAPDDPFAGSKDLAGPVAEQLGARTAVLPGQGHWWMLGDPDGGAAVLEDFWASL
jgi:pimeloyl-ACP methyl ester carboxylesterase